MYIWMRPRGPAVVHLIFAPLYADDIWIHKPDIQPHSLLWRKSTSKQSQQKKSYILFKKIYGNPLYSFALCCGVRLWLCLILVAASLLYIASCWWPVQTVSKVLLKFTAIPITLLQSHHQFFFLFVRKLLLIYKTQDNGS